MQVDRLIDFEPLGIAINLVVNADDLDAHIGRRRIQHLHIDAAHRNCGAGIIAIVVIQGSQHYIGIAGSKLVGAGYRRRYRFDRLLPAANLSQHLNMIAEIGNVEVIGEANLVTRLVDRQLDLALAADVHTIATDILDLDGDVECSSGNHGFDAIDNNLRRITRHYLQHVDRIGNSGVGRIGKPCENAVVTGLQAHHLV